MLKHIVKKSKIATIVVVLLASTMIGAVSAEETSRDEIFEESGVDDVDDLGGIFTKEECEAAGGVWIRSTTVKPCLQGFCLRLV